MMHDGADPEDALIRELVRPGVPRWPAPWAAYVMALMVGATVAGEPSVDVASLFFGLPLAWLVGWSSDRLGQWGWVGAVALAFVGLVVGLTVQ